MKKIKTLLLALTLCPCLLSGCIFAKEPTIVDRIVDPTEETENQNIIRGIIKCENEFLSGVIIDYDGKQYSSMENGRFIIRSAFAEGGKITFSKNGYFDYRYKLEKNDFIEGEAVINIQMTHKVTISGITKDTWGNILTGVKVSCGEVFAYSDDNGKYSISELTVSDHKLNFTKDGYFSTSRIIKKEWYDKKGNLKEIDINLHKITSIRGTVKDENGNALSGVKVICGSQIDFTDSDGSYFLTNICPEPKTEHQNSGYDVEFYLDGYTYQNAQYATYGYGNQGQTITRIIHPSVDLYENPNAILNMILVKIS